MTSKRIQKVKQRRLNRQARRERLREVIRHAKTQSSLVQTLQILIDEMPAGLGNRLRDRLEEALSDYQREEPAETTRVDSPATTRGRQP